MHKARLPARDPDPNSFLQWLRVWWFRDLSGLFIEVLSGKAPGQLEPGVLGIDSPQRAGNGSQGNDAVVR